MGRAHRHCRSTPGGWRRDDSRRAQPAPAAIYSINNPSSPFYDSNAFQNIPAPWPGNGWCDTYPGYNPVTGWGSPNVQNLVPDLVAYDPTPASNTVYWTGDAGDSNWNSVLNWSTLDPLVDTSIADQEAAARLPGPLDNVMVDLSNQTINHGGYNANTYDKISSLTVTGSNDTLNLYNGTLDVSGGGALGAFDSPASSGDAVYLDGGVLEEATVMADTAVTVQYWNFSYIDGGVLNGTIEVQYGATLDLEGSWTNSVTGTITADYNANLILGNPWDASTSDPAANAAQWFNYGAINTGSNGYVDLGGWMVGSTRLSNSQLE